MDGILCCIFNYAPLYREAVYREIDRAFDAQFCFADEVVAGRGGMGIKRLDTGIFRHPVKKIKNRMFFGRHPWRSGILGLPFHKKYSTFLITGDLDWAYIPFLLLCKLTGKRVFGWGHGIKSMKKNARFKRFFYNRLDGYFIYGSRGRDRMVQLGFSGDKFHVIYNSLVYSLDGKGNDSLKSDVYREHFGNGDPTIVFSGRLTAAKRVDILLEAVLRLNSASPRVNLVIIGDGPEKDNLEKMVSEADRIWFYGECYDEAKTAGLLYNADICVSPGNVGLMAIHAMQCGTPVISHSNFETQMPEYETIVTDSEAPAAIGCMPEGKEHPTEAMSAEDNSAAAESGPADDAGHPTGALFKEGDADDLCRTIDLWLTRHGGDREEIRKNCREVIAAHWTASTQIETLKSVLG